VGSPTPPPLPPTPLEGGTPSTAIALPPRQPPNLLPYIYPHMPTTKSLVEAERYDFLRQTSGNVVLLANDALRVAEAAIRSLAALLSALSHEEGSGAPKGEP